MMNWKQIGRLAIAPVLALGMAVSLTAYHTAKPVVAKAAAAPSAAPLDENSVSALLALDQAMETLAARVTPAIVNVAVTSKPKADEQAQAEIPDEMQRFFGDTHAPWDMRAYFNVLGYLLMIICTVLSAIANVGAQSNAFKRSTIVVSLVAVADTFFLWMHLVVGDEASGIGQLVHVGPGAWVGLLGFACFTVAGALAP